jgi:hypothetical protein
MEFVLGKKKKIFIQNSSQCHFLDEPSIYHQDMKKIKSSIKIQLMLFRWWAIIINNKMMDVHWLTTKIGPCVIFIIN